MRVSDLEAGALIVLHCCNPKEKMWGLLLRVDALGVVVRGLDLNSVDDWFRQEASGEPAMLAPSTQFVPMHRIERMFLDESTGGVPGYGDRYRTSCGRDPGDALRGQTGEQAH